ncbi:hypothetical protein AB0L64_31450 [Kribbella sp. NPDC051936]|uniref:SAM-dependent methyltransferase n=1 Tax=Kribbella sp. NPDC051936 TaxID=3154946 RepID=UPI00342B308A
MRVLDLGCGTALSSIFLAREYDVDVWAADLWVDPTENWRRVDDAGLAGRVHPRVPVRVRPPGWSLVGLTRVVAHLK